MTLDTVRQPALNGFDMCNVQADIANEEQREQKPVTGWGSRCLLGKRSTEDSATNYHETGIVWMKGGPFTGHHNKRLGDIPGMTELCRDQSRQPAKLDEWIIGRICRDCGQRKTLDSHHFYPDDKSLHGFRSICRDCIRYGERRKYATGKHGNVREYSRIEV